MEQLEVQFLGCGDAMGSGGRFHTCISLKHEYGRALIDCGASSMIAIRRFEVDPSEIDLILISHLHGDHFGGLPFFILDARFVSRRRRPLVVAGPPGVEDRVRQAMEVFYPGSSDQAQNFELSFVELAPETTRRIGAVTVTPETVVHSSGAPAYALRVVCGSKCVGFSGDTEWTDNLTRVSTGADLFICEASFFDAEIPNHLAYQTVVDRQPDLDCRRLILTHLSQEMLDRRDEIELEVAEDGKRIVL